MNPAFEKLRKFLRDRNTTRKNNWVKIFAGRRDQIEKVPELDLNAPEFLVSENWIGDRSEAELYKSIWAQSDTDYLNNLNSKRLGYNPAKISQDIRGYMMAENLRVANDTDKYKERLNKWAADKADAIKHLEPEYSGKDVGVLNKIAEAKMRDSRNSIPIFGSAPQAFSVPVRSSSPSRGNLDRNQPVLRANEQMSFDVDSNLNETESILPSDLPSKLNEWREIIAKLDPSKGDHCSPTPVIKKIFEDKDFKLENIHHSDFNTLVNIFTDSVLSMEKEHIQKIYDLGNTILSNIRNYRKLKYEDFEEYVLKFFISCKSIADLEKFSVEYEERLLKENVAKLENLGKVIEELKRNNENGVTEQPEKIEDYRAEIYQLIVPATHCTLKTTMITDIQELLSQGQIKNPENPRKRSRKRSESESETKKLKNQAVESQDLNISERKLDRRSSFTAAKEKLTSKKAQ